MPTNPLTKKDKSNTNMKRIIQFSDIVLTGLIAGIIFGVWLGYNPEGLSAVTYVEQQQNTIRALNVLMPILGLISIILTVVYAIICKREKLERNSLLLAVGLLIVSGLITRFGNQPINAIVITWNLDAIPDTWTAFRDKWWTFHVMRTLSTIAGFTIIVWVTIRNKNKSTTA
jgi:uncharacterized membrane protein YwaF